MQKSRGDADGATASASPSPPSGAMAPRDAVLAVLAALIWGATFLFTQAALREAPPLLFAALRFCCVAPFALLVPRPRVSWPLLAAAGLLLGAGQYGFQFLGMAHGVAPGMASLLAHTQAFFTVGIAAVAFAERLGSRRRFAMLLGFAGLAALILDRGGHLTPTGLLFSVAGACCGAAGNAVLKALGRGVNMLGVAVWMSLAAPLPLLLLSAVVEGPAVIADTLASHIVGWTVPVALAYSAVLATITAFAIWGRLLATYAAVQVAPFFLLVPVFGIGLSVAVTGERFGGQQAAGCLLIFVGLVLTFLPERRRRAAVASASLTAADR
jgi:O-acetylserine/cysteine efflux transporter